MLKIKDNVDLKELERFGFLEKTDVYLIVTWREVAFLSIDKKTRIIENYGHFFLTKLFDLIQAGLVEKVGGKDE